MPRPTVNRLRELRKLQNKRRLEQHQQQMSATAPPPQYSASYADSVQHARQVLNTSAIDDLVDELS